MKGFAPKHYWLRLRSAFWNGIAGALPRVAMLLAGLFVAHRFGPDDYARYSLAFATFALAGTLPGMTLTTVVSRFVPEYFERRHSDAGMATVVRFTAVVGISLGAFVILLSPALSRLFAVDPPVTALLQLAALAATLTVFAGGMAGWLVGSARFGTSAAAFGFGFLLFAATLIPLSDRWGPGGALLALALLFGGTAVIALVTARPSPWSGFAIAAVPQGYLGLWRFYLPMLIAAGLVTPVMWLTNALLARHAAPLAELSRFNAAYSWFAVLSFVPAVLAQVEFVAVARARARGERSGLARKLRRFVLQNALVMFPLALVAAALTPALMGLYQLEGPDAERTLMLMIGAAFVASLGNPAGLFLSVSDRTWIASGMNALWGLVTLGLLVLFAQDGAVGAALAFFLAYCLHFALAFTVAHRVLSRS